MKAPAQGFADAFTASAPSSQYRQAPAIPAVPDLPTGPIPTMGRGADWNASSLRGTSGTTSELAPELVDLYGDYLRDLQPDLPVHAESPAAYVAPPHT